jgi:transcriptional regulator with XRE-family HTH domain
MKQRSDTRASQARQRILGAGIRRHRGTRTQTELADLVGLSQGSISAWETGIVPLTCEQVVLVETALGLRTGTLLLESGYVDQELLGADAVAAFALGKLQAAFDSLGIGGGGAADIGTTRPVRPSD